MQWTYAGQIGRFLCFGAASLSMLACGDSAAPGPLRERTLEINARGLGAYEPSAGTLQLWVISEDGDTVSAGALVGTQASLRVSSSAIRKVLITLEPARDADANPSSQVLLQGTVRDGRVSLLPNDVITAANLSFTERPGQFTMFSPSDNAVHSYPSFESAGIWLFNARPRETVQNDMWVRLSQLREGWLYEGWMVRDIDTPGAIWLSYGKFRPDRSGVINSRDDTGWGPFSGALDFATAGEEEFPGDDWIENPLALPFPSPLRLPLDLTERTPGGAQRWTHVITVEPAFDRGEPIGSERPFVVRPYRDPFMITVPGSSQAITFQPSGVPSAEVVIR